MDHEKLREAKKKVGNTFALTVLLQKRCQELVRGAQRLVALDAKNPADIALEEILQGKIWLGEAKKVERAPDAVAAAAAALGTTGPTAGAREASPNA
jgi:DNA-directed RNA polymerase subunit K/omega